MTHDEQRFNEALFQIGEDRENYYGAVVPPIVQTSNFSFKSIADLRLVKQHEFEKPFYTRGFNPTVSILRQKLAALEQTEDALVCSSGSSAVALAVIGNVRAGDHVICVNKPYSWTTTLLSGLLSRFGVETTFIDGSEIQNFEQALKPHTRLIFLESPNSVTFELQDIEAVSLFAKKHSLLTVIDNSYATPYYQRPHLQGIDLIVHSATKFLNGHSDVVAGAICGSKEHISRLFAAEWMTLGFSVSPHDAWLMLRGLRTFEIRMERSVSTAQKIIPQLLDHPSIEKIYWPFLESNPQYILAKRQMSGCPSMFSIELKSKQPQATDYFCDALKHFQIACSWGGYESLVFPVSALSSSLKSGNLIRIYLGLENPEILLNDLLDALEKLKSIDE